jgi:hypothetical protein
VIFSGFPDDPRGGLVHVLARFPEEREFRALMCVKCFSNLHSGNLVPGD